MKGGDGGIRLTAEEGNRLLLEMPSKYLELFEAMASGKEKPEHFRLHWREAPDLTKRALLGDFELLISHFERGGALTDQERRTLAKIARGKLPRMGRPPQTKTETRNRDIVRFVKILKAYGGKRVVDVAAKKFEVDHSYIPKLEKNNQTPQ